VIRHIIAILLAGLIGHGLLIGGVLGAGVGGAYAAFTATAIQFALVTAALVQVTPDGLTQAALLALGPFFAPVLAAITLLAVLAIIARRRDILFHIFVAAFLTGLPLALRFGQANPGGPAVDRDDLVLVGAAGAVAGLVYWLIAGRRIARQAAIRG